MVVLLAIDLKLKEIITPLVFGIWSILNFTNCNNTVIDLSALCNVQHALNHEISKSLFRTKYL